MDSDAYRSEESEDSLSEDEKKRLTKKTPKMFQRTTCLRFEASTLISSILFLELEHWIRPT